MLLDRYGVLQGKMTMPSSYFPSNTKVSWVVERIGHRTNKIDSQWKFRLISVIYSSELSYPFSYNQGTYNRFSNKIPRGFIGQFKQHMFLHVASDYRLSSHE